MRSIEDMILEHFIKYSLEEGIHSPDLLLEFFPECSYWIAKYRIDNNYPDLEDKGKEQEDDILNG